MPAPASLRPSPRGAPRWHKLVVVAVLLAAAGCSGAADTPSSPRSTRPPPTPTGTTVPALDRGRFAAVIPLPGAGPMTVADGMLWVLKGAGTVVRVDPATNRVVGKPLLVPADAAAIAVAQGALWVTSVAPGDLGTPGKDTVTRIDLATGRTVATITVPRAPLDLAVTPRAVWVTNAGGGGDSVARIDPQTNRLVGRPVTTGDSPQSLTVGGGSLWVANHDERTVARIDQASGKVVADIPVPSEPHRVAYGADAVWVGNWHDNSVSRIDPGTNRVVGSPIPIGFHAGNLAVGAGDLWVTSDYRPEAAPEDVVVIRIDPQTNQAVETVALGGHPIDIAVTAGGVWVSVTNPGTLLRIAGRQCAARWPDVEEPLRDLQRGSRLGLTRAAWRQQATLPAWADVAATAIPTDEQAYRWPPRRRLDRHGGHCFTVDSGVLIGASGSGAPGRELRIGRSRCLPGSSRRPGLRSGWSPWPVSRRAGRGRWRTRWPG